MSETVTATPTYVEEVDAIIEAMQGYIEGGRTGIGATMKSTFHDDATIFGYVGPDLFAGPIQGLYDWNDENGPATDPSPCSSHSRSGSWRLSLSRRSTIRGAGRRPC